MSDRADIENVFNRYSLAYDKPDLDEMEACFTPDAVMSMRIAGGDLIGPFEGRDAIMTLMRDSLASQSDQRRHLTTNLVLRSQTESSASTESYLTLISVADGALTVLSTAVYVDELVKRDGQWLFTKRHIELDLPY
ncbi:MAG: nuclear transport factor 2 family protein [Actinomycetales bacterium]